jgi:hypothetical protein
LNVLHASLSPLVLGQLKNLHKHAVGSFREQVATRLKGDAYDFGVVVAEVGKKVEDDFVVAAKGELISRQKYGRPG